MPANFGSSNHQLAVRDFAALLRRNETWMRRLDARITARGASAGSGGSAATSYAEQWAMPAQVISNAQTTTVVGLVPTQSTSDYTSAPMNPATGVWVCPEDGWYDFHAGVIYDSAFATFPANMRTVIMLSRGSSVTTYFGYSEILQGSSSAAGTIFTAIKQWISKGEQITVRVYQQSGVAQRIKVDPRSYLTIARSTSGATGPQGPPGTGVLPGGLLGQVLTKKTDADYDTYWNDPAKGGGTLNPGTPITGPVTVLINTFYPINLPAGSGHTTVTLPPNAPQGSQIAFSRVDSNVFTADVSIAPSAGDTVVDQNPYPLVMRNSTLRLTYVGTAWYPEMSVVAANVMLGTTPSSVFNPSIMARDNFGRAQVEDPVGNKDIVNLEYLRAYGGGGGGGVDEVIVQPDDPAVAHPSIELWVDTDDAGIVGAANQVLAMLGNNPAWTAGFAPIYDKMGSNFWVPPLASTLYTDPVYPDGMSAMALSTTQATAGAWPLNASCEVLTVKFPNSSPVDPTATGWGRCFQIWARNSASVNDCRYRQGSTTGWTPWMPLSGPTMWATITNVTINNVNNASKAITFPAGLFSTSPALSMTTHSGSAWTAGASNTTAAGTTVGVRSESGGNGGSDPLPVSVIAVDQS